jgi:hypothetical protein
MGPAEDPPVTVECPLRDSLRTVYPWFALGGLLLLRKSNRTRRAWAILLPLLAIYGILGVMESTIKGHTLWYVSVHACSVACAILQSLALGLAFHLAVSDRIKIPYRFLRFLLTFAVIFAAGSAALLLNAPVALNTVVWVAALGVTVLVFLVGLAVVTSLLRRLVSRHQLAWHAGVCLVLGIGPILVFAGNEWLLHYFMPPLNAQSLNAGEQLRIATILSQVLFTPYFMVFWFAVPALLSPFYRPRFASCFLRLNHP